MCFSFCYTTSVCVCMCVCVRKAWVGHSLKHCQITGKHCICVHMGVLLSHHFQRGMEGVGVVHVWNPKRANHYWHCSTKAHKSPLRGSGVSTLQGHSWTGATRAPEWDPDFSAELCADKPRHSAVTSHRGVFSLTLSVNCCAPPHARLWSLFRKQELLGPLYGWMVALNCGKMCLGSFNCIAVQYQLCMLVFRCE